MKFRPLHDRVLVRRVESDQKTAGGIIIPDTAQEKPMEGEVIEVGKKVKKGDTIIYTKFSATEVQHDGEEYFFVAERDIIAVIPNEEK